MQVFVSNVDRPIGHAVSRILAHTIVGCRKSIEDEDFSALDPATANTYTVVGSLSAPPPEDAPEDTGAVTKNAVATKKGAVGVAETLPQSGVRPQWVSSVVPVRFA